MRQIALSKPYFRKMISNVLLWMSCSQFAKDSAARIDSGTSGCVQAIVLWVGLGRAAQGAGLLFNPNVGPDCLYVCPLSIRAVYQSASGAVWDQSLRRLEFPFEGGQGA